jgi:GxxExxY protein
LTFLCEALAVAFRNKNIPVKEQVYYHLKFKEKVVGRAFLDFLVEDKIIVEIKKEGAFIRPHIDQVLNYLKLSDHKLAILIKSPTRESSSRE